MILFFSGPTYAALGPNNSATLPARFILKLSQTMPICGALLKMIIAAGESESASLVSPNSTSSLLSNMKPLLSLVACHAAGAEINPNKGLFVVSINHILLFSICTLMWLCSFFFTMYFTIFSEFTRSEPMLFFDWDSRFGWKRSRIDSVHTSESSACSYCMPSTTSTI